MVSGELPVVEAPLVVTVMVEVPLVAIVVGLKLAVASAGSPLALSVTVPVNPPRAEMDTV